MELVVDTSFFAGWAMAEGWDRIGISGIKQAETKTLTKYSIFELKVVMTIGTNTGIVGTLLFISDPSNKS